MEHYALQYANTALMMGCSAMAMVFLTMPLPPNKGLDKYRISLRFLSGAYLTMTILKMGMMISNVALVSLIPIEGMAIATLQANLFAFALITLINPHYITIQYVYKQLIPILSLLIIYSLMTLKWRDPIILSFDELRTRILYPTVVIREILLLYYLFLLVDLTRAFLLNIQKYEQEIDNFFTDNLRLHLPGVRYSYYAAHAVGFSVLLSNFIFSPELELIFTIAYTVFYMVFGIYYIQYPRTFIKIEQAIYPPKDKAEESVKNNKRFNWNELKNQSIDEKYYLKSGVNIEEMAQYLKMGRTTLSNLINNEEGMSFNLWINTLRIEDAKQLLVKYPSYNINQIAEMVGYSESSNFCRQFKLLTNESPSVWRQNQYN